MATDSVKKQGIRNFFFQVRRNFPGRNRTVRREGHVLLRVYDPTSPSETGPDITTKRAKRPSASSVGQVRNVCAHCRLIGKGITMTRY